MGAVLPPPEELLQDVPFYRRLPPEERKRLAAVSRVKLCAKGETIFAEGAPADVFFTIVRGRVKVFKSTPAGKDLILEIFGTGDPLGAVAVYEDRPYPASAVALEDTLCLLIRRQDFFALLERYPSLVRGLLLGLTRRLVELTNRLAELTGGRVEPRFARLFLKLADQMGQPAAADGTGTFIPLPLSRQELADLSGTTLETCIRIMSRWGKEGIVQTTKEGFVVLDRAALATLGLE
jgi:CRP/FNR family transcriptional regulator, nitrogen oxide reductase regulator